jgi:hypothetical protein
MATMDPTTLPLPTALHLGALHPVEQLLVYLLAFGPFAVLAVVVVVRRRRDRLEDDAAATTATATGTATGTGTTPAPGRQRDR